MKLEEFIFRKIASVDHLRAILLLHADPSVQWSEMEIAGRLYLPPERVTEVMVSLVACGFALKRADTGRFSFVSQEGESASLLEQVVAMDRERPVSLIRLIYSRSDSLEAFSDAFRLRRN